MHELVGKAVVLRYDSFAEKDARAVLFFEELGKLVVRVKSARKLTSKLSPHLQEGNLVQVRVVEKKGPLLVDALKLQRLSISLPHLHFLDSLLQEGNPDPELWPLLHESRFSWVKALSVLGWDPRGALCRGCEKKKPTVFYPTTHDLLCADCSSKIGQHRLLLVE